MKREPHAPVQHGVEIRVSNREVVKQKFPVAKMIIEIRETRFALHQNMRSCSLGRGFIEQHAKQTLMQFRADEAQPLLQTRACKFICRGEVRLGKSIGNILESRGVLAQQRTVIKAQQGTSPSG